METDAWAASRPASSEPEPDSPEEDPEPKAPTASAATPAKARKPDPDAVRGPQEVPGPESQVRLTASPHQCAWIDRRSIRRPFPRFLWRGLVLVRFPVQAPAPTLASVKEEVSQPEAEGRGSVAAAVTAVKQELPLKKRRKHRHVAAGPGQEGGGLQAVKAEDAPAGEKAAAPAQDQPRKTKQSAQDAGRKAKQAEHQQAPPAAAPRPRAHRQVPLPAPPAEHHWFHVFTLRDVLQG